MGELGCGICELQQSLGPVLGCTTVHSPACPLCRGWLSRAALQQCTMGWGGSLVAWAPLQAPCCCSSHQPGMQTAGDAGGGTPGSRAAVLHGLPEPSQCHIAKQSFREPQPEMLPSPILQPPWGKSIKVEVVPEATKKLLIAFRGNCHLLLVSSPSPTTPCSTSFPNA